MTTDTSERGLEQLICVALTGQPCEPPAATTVREPSSALGGVGWSCGNPHDYNREYCVDLTQLAAFFRSTQPEAAESLSLSEDGPTRRRFLARLQGEISKRGTIDVLRHGIKHGAHNLDLFYGTPSAENPKAQATLRTEPLLSHPATPLQPRRNPARARHRTLHQRSPSLHLRAQEQPDQANSGRRGLAVQEGPQPAREAVRVRPLRGPLRLDEGEIRFCTHVKGKASWFLPFNRGWKDGAGNPPNPSGIKTDYLWRKVLTRASLANILENYAQLIESKDEKTGKKKKTQIWPRYHQLDVVRRLLADVADHGAGRRYLIQHSAGSGKSNSIAWLAHQLIGLSKDDAPIFDSIIVVTDRRILDRQIHDTIKQYAQIRATVGHAKRSGDLRQFIESGKKIIISTVQKFPFILKEIGDEQRGRRFAIVIDEAHSSQGGRTSAAMAGALSEAGRESEEETYEDRINRIMESHKLLPNASYFAFTATPKNKTLEIFGDPDPQPDGAVKHRPFHSYTMKQAIQEGFILDVLAHYTPVNSYYKLAKTVEEDPEFDVKKARKKLRRFVEGHDHAIRLKAEIMVDHFQDQVLNQGRIGGEARAMVVTNGVARAIQYFHAISDYLKERKSRYRAIVAFSGDFEFGGENVTEASMNGFPSNKIAERIQEDPYRFLVCADKFQTGYDEPLLHSMYVDKTLSGIKAVQTLSRLNRAHPKKHDVFVLDFLNDTDTIQQSFTDYYRTTILADETDPNKLHDLQGDLDGAQVYSRDQIDDFVRRYLGDAERDELDPILDACVASYLKELDEDGQVDFKGKAKAFVRTYAFLSSVLPYGNAAWEKLSIFLNFLIPKLPSPKEDDLSKGILEAIDMDSYRIEKRKMEKIVLADEDAEIDPVPADGGGHLLEPEMDRLSNIVREFNDLFGDVQWDDADRVRRLIIETIPARVAADAAFQNARQNSDKQNARIEHDKALLRVMTSVMKDDTELFKQFMDNPSFKRWMSERSFGLAYEQAQPSQTT